MKRPMLVGAFTGRATALMVCSTMALAQGAPDPLPDPVPDIPLGTHVLRLTDIVSELVFPTDVAVPPDGSPRLFVNQVSGKTWVLVDGVTQSAPFLDFSSDYFASNGSAMSSLVFHPDFSANRKLYVVMTENQDPALADFGVLTGVDQQSVLYEVEAQAGWPDVGCNLVDPASKRELLRINEDFTIHNLNDLAFGPEGYLYLTKGDDASGGQDLTTVHGAVLRIDVDFAPGNPLSANGQYAIPAGNPFVGAGSGVVEEIWAYGFRNPWRLSVDGSDVWVADVGESVIEEVDRVVAGGHHGWPWKAGSFAHLSGGAVSVDLSGLPTGVYIDPVGEYDHGQLDVSISGGVVYRGTAFPQLAGAYIFGDWVSGRLFAMDTSTGAIEQFTIDPAGAFIAGQLSGFPWEGVIAVEADADGELLIVVSQRNETSTGRILRVTPANWDDLGGALAGVAGEPELVGKGPLLAGWPAGLELTGAATLALSTLVIGATQLGVPFKGGLMVPNPDALVSALTTDAGGALQLSGSWPAGIPSGVATYYQVWIVDPSGPAGFSASNGVRGSTP